MWSTFVAPQTCGKKLYSGYLYFIAHVICKPFVLWQRKNSGIDNVPKDVPVIIAANHLSPGDPWRIATLLRWFQTVHWVGKKELFNVEDVFADYSKKMPKTPKHIVRLLSYVAVYLVVHSFTICINRSNPKSVKENKKGISDMKQVLDHGGVLGIFPEGGTSRRGQVTSVFITLALRYNAYIVPTYIDPKTKSVTFKQAIPPDEIRMFETNELAAQHVIDTIYEQ